MGEGWELEAIGLLATLRGSELLTTLEDIELLARPVELGLEGCADVLKGALLEAKDELRNGLLLADGVCDADTLRLEDDATADDVELLILDDVSLESGFRNFARRTAALTPMSGMEL